jgi:hypothetical protein
VEIDYIYLGIAILLEQVDGNSGLPSGVEVMEAGL